MTQTELSQVLTDYLRAHGNNRPLSSLWEAPDRQRPSALCWLVDGTRVLLLRRRKEPFAGFWTAPGGKLDPGEDPLQAVVREIREETGLALRAPRLRAVASELGGPLYDWLLFLFTADEFSGRLQPCDEGELAWFERDQLAHIRMADPDFRLAQIALDDGPVAFAKIRYDSAHSISSWTVEPLAAGD